MHSKLTVTLLLLLTIIACGMTIGVDDDGNILKVEQRATAELDGGGRAVTIFLEWGNLNEVEGVGFHSFNGYVAPEDGECKVVDVRMFDTGGSYNAGRADEILHDGPAYVRWKASTKGKNDGLTVLVVVEQDTIVHVKVGEWHGQFKISAGGEVVPNSLQESEKPWELGPATNTP